MFVRQAGILGALRMPLNQHSARRDSEGFVETANGGQPAGETPSRSAVLPPAQASAFARAVSALRQAWLESEVPLKLLRRVSRP
jgi:hypothetical protein